MRNSTVPGAGSGSEKSCTLNVPSGLSRTTARAVGIACSALDRAGGQSGSVLFDKERVDQRDRHRTEQGPRHQWAPEIEVGAGELGEHTYGDRTRTAGGDECQGVDELVPAQREREDTGGQDARGGQRERDPTH